MLSYAQTIDQVKKVWMTFEQDWPFEYRLLEKDISQLYENEKKLFNLVIILSVLAILISFCGLFGINSLSIMRKYKTISIKKVLGAHAATIFTEIIKTEFISLALVLFVAAPLGYYTITHWLNGFQFRASITLTEFIIAGALTTTLVLATLLFHLLKLMRVNPVEYIKME